MTTAPPVTSATGDSGSGGGATDDPEDTGDTDDPGDTGVADSTGDEGTTGSPPVCGDGTVDDGEDCDDGRESPTCNADCTTATCGDGQVNAAAGEDCDDAGRSGTCNADCTSAACGDGLVNATAGEACDDAGESATCNADCSTASCGDGVINATAGEECDDAGASASCDVDCTAATCGDGTFNAAAGEECDDAGRSAACDSDCTNVSCGDGVLNATAGEACDDGGESAACNSDCSVASCGDGITNAAAGEACDDAGESLTCDTDCTAASCGDGLTNATAGEACDDAGSSATCDADCTAAVCLDGVLNALAGETCDDGAQTATCDGDCSPAACGDGFVNAAAGETCDDGGTGTQCFPDCTACPNTVLLSEDFSDNALGWTLGVEWGIGPAVASASPGACGNGDPGVDHTPTADNGIAGAVIGGNIGTALHPFYYLTSPPIDASGAGNLELSLWRWLNSDYTPFMQNHIQVWNGAAWQTVWQTGGAPGNQDAAWNLQVYDISGLANANLQVRIGYNIDSGGVYTCSGWNVDDITISGTDCSTPQCGVDPVATALAACAAEWANCEIVDGGVVGWNAPECTGCNCGPASDPWRFYCTEDSDASNYNCSACSTGQILGSHDPCNCDPDTSPVLGDFCSP